VRGDYHAVVICQEMKIKILELLALRMDDPPTALIEVPQVIQAELD
jgi:hypothetical protein